MKAPEAHPTVSVRWLLTAALASLAAAAVCGWLTLCLLFWQGTWQLLYHPSAVVARTPANQGIAFEPVSFAATEAGIPRLKGWWIPAAHDAHYARFTVLYLHGQTGNLGDSVDALTNLHNLGLNILAFDYRGYGQSQFVHPSEAHWREDAKWALAYLTATRHVSADSILLDGNQLGASLALQVAAQHPELVGVVLESPPANPAEAIFNDPRSRLIPAQLLVRDRYDAASFATSLSIPSLWLVRADARNPAEVTQPPGYPQVKSEKMLIWLQPQGGNTLEVAQAYTRWLDQLPQARRVH